MKRRLFTFGWAMSLVACAAMLALWARSSRVTDLLIWERPWGQVELISSRGLIRLWYVEFVDPDGQMQARPPRRQWRTHRPPSDFWPVSAETDWRFLGVSRWNRRGGPVIDDRISVPHAVLALATAGLPLGAAVRAGRRYARRRQLRRRGLCRACGYDLRASPERCPECGAAAGDGRTD